MGFLYLDFYPVIAIDLLDEIYDCMLCYGIFHIEFIVGKSPWDFFD
jgi:hypothetical protein